MTTFYYDVNAYSSIVALIEAHPTARAEHIRMRGPDLKLRYLDNDGDAEVQRLKKAAPRRDDDRDQAPAQLRVRLHNDEYGQCVGAARSAGLNVREWATRVLLAASKVDKPAAIRPQAWAIGSDIGADGGAVRATPCLACDATGKIADMTCDRCGGDGEIELR